MRRKCYIKSVCQSSERCIGQREPRWASVSSDAGSASDSTSDTSGLNALTSLDRTGTISSLYPVTIHLEGTLSPVWYELAPFIHSPAALISITDSLDTLGP